MLPHISQNCSLDSNQLTSWEFSPRFTTRTRSREPGDAARRQVSPTLGAFTRATGCFSLTATRHSFEKPSFIAGKSPRATLCPAQKCTFPPSKYTRLQLETVIKTEGLLMESLTEAGKGQLEQTGAASARTFQPIYTDRGP